MAPAGFLPNRALRIRGKQWVRASIIVESWWSVCLEAFKGSRGPSPEEGHIEHIQVLRIDRQAATALS
jgi:hypothetical protein